MRRLLTLLVILVAGTASTASRAETRTLPWQKWDPALLDRAASEHKYILLRMAAVWCHWCHVMEGTTYRDPAIQATILRDLGFHRRLPGCLHASGVHRQALHLSALGRRFSPSFPEGRRAKHLRGIIDASLWKGGKAMVRIVRPRAGTLAMRTIATF